MLTAEQQESFWRFGYLPLGQVADPSRLNGLLRAFDRLTTSDPAVAAPEDHLIRSAAGDGHVRVGLHLCHIDDAFRDFATDPGAAAYPRALFGSDVTVLTSLLFNKPPGTGEALAPHQDLPYYPYLDDGDLITVWTALDPVGVGNGPVEYVPGSHRRRVPHRRSGAQQALDIAAGEVDLSCAATVLLAAGEAVAHHGLTVHRSAANVGGPVRRGIATLYLRASVMVSVDDFPYAPLRPEGGPS